MKTLKLGIFSGLLATTLLFTGSGAQTLAMAETQETAPADDLQSCAENIKRIYKERYPDNDDVIDEIVDIISSDDEFIYIFENEGSKAFQIVEDSLRDVLDPTPEPYYVVNGVYQTACAVPTVTQAKNNYCGPASVLQALIGTGDLSNTSDNKSKAKQDDVAKRMGMGSNGARVDDITIYMNTYYLNTATSNSYKSVLFPYTLRGKVISYLTYSLQHNGATIVRISDTSLLGYYNNVSCEHFVTVTKVDTIFRTITIVDPTNLSGLGGEHVITYDELFETARVGSGLWVSVYTNNSGGSYVYE